MATKIMLVEDDTNLSSIYQARLEAEGFQIIIANDGEAALALAVKEKPELIISDVMMPKISGFDMLDILRGTDGIKDTKVIMMTALGQAEDKARAEKLGADRYLVKSQVTLEDVVRTVHEVLEDQPVPAAVAEGTASEAPAPAPAAEEQPTPAVPAPETQTASIPVAEPSEPAAPAPVSESPMPTPAAADIPVQAAPAISPTSPASDPVPEPTQSAQEPAAAVPVSEPPAPITPPAQPTGTSTQSAVANDQTSSTEQAAVLSQIQDFIDKQEADAAPPAEAPVQPAPTEQTNAVAPAPTGTLPAETTGKKVIEPIVSPVSKPSLSELLDKEQSGAAPASNPQTGTNNSTDGFISSSAAGSVIQPTALNNDIDPNKVSL